MLYFGFSDYAFSITHMLGEVSWEDVTTSWSELASGNQRLSPLPVLGRYLQPTIPILGAIFKDCNAWKEQCVAETMWTRNALTPLRHLYKFSRFCGQAWRSSHLVDAQNRPLHKFLCLLNLPAANLEGLPLSQSLLCLLYSGSVSSHLENFTGWELMILFSFYDYNVWEY